MIRFTNCRILFFFATCYTLTTACVRDKSDSRDIVIKNSSAQSIYSILSPDDTMFGLGHYEEFREGSRGAQPGFEFHFSEIRPGMSDYQHDAPMSWEVFFEKTPDKSIRIYIVNYDLVKKFGWKKIFNEKIFTKKIKISKEELDKKQWEIEIK